MAAASGSGAKGSGADGAGSDCEGEDQDEPSSSHLSELRADEAFGNLTIDDEKKNDAGSELAAFRQQWQQELSAHSSPQKRLNTYQREVDKDDPDYIQWPQDLDYNSQESPRHVTYEYKESEEELAMFRQQWQRELDAPPPPPRAASPEPLSDDDRAKQLFLRGVELERGGKLYEAIQHYKRAMQILPDVEARLYDADARADSPLVEEEHEMISREEEEHPSDDEDAVEGEGLLARLQRIQARRGRLCEPAVHTKGGHISWLPEEVVMLVLRWAVGAELDAAALERLAATCRGLYVLARSHDLWRALCRRTWGIDCGTPRALGFDSWRAMYVERPRVQLNGCYISKTTYLRHGENAYQDTFYRPWYLIDYFRYLRFFPDGLVLMWTTADEPAACVGQLRQRAPKPGLGIMSGHYRLVGQKVVIIIKKVGEKKPPPPTNTRFRARRKEPAEPHEQTYHLELELRSVRRRRNVQLVWARYAVCSRREQWTTFELSGNKFPPFCFSCVRQYTREAHAPL